MRKTWWELYGWDADKATNYVQRMADRVEEVMAGVPPPGTQVAWRMGRNVLFGTVTGAPVEIRRNAHPGSYLPRWDLTGPVDKDLVPLTDVLTVLRDPTHPQVYEALQLTNDRYAVVPVERIRGHIAGHPVTETGLVATRVLVDQPPPPPDPASRGTLPARLARTPTSTSPNEWVVTAWPAERYGPVIPPGSQQRARSFPIRSQAAVGDLVRTVMQGFGEEDLDHLWAIANTATADYVVSTVLDGAEWEPSHAETNWSGTASDLVRPGDLAMFVFDFGHSQHFTVWRHPKDTTADPRDDTLSR